MQKKLWKKLVKSFLVFLSLMLAGCESGSNDGSKTETGKINEPVSSPASSQQSEDIQKKTGVAKTEQGAASIGKEMEILRFSEDPVYVFGIGPLQRSEDWEHAGRVVDYNNQARSAGSQNWFRLPDILWRNALDYLENWKLEPAPKVSSGKIFSRKLAVPRGLFSREDETSLTRALNDMDDALAKMLGHYHDLEKYVKDETIIDDGSMGKLLVKKIKTLHGRFMSARKSWREIVHKRAAQAEDLLLREHPLRRQILSAGNIFAAIDEVSDMIEAGSPDKAALQDIAANLTIQIGEGEKPPFASLPYLERLYRGFLHEAKEYQAILNRAIMEGFHNVQQRELLASAADCVKSYNGFVAAYEMVTHAPKVYSGI